MTIEVRTQAELDKALKVQAKTGEMVACIGKGFFRIAGSSSVEAWESSRVVAWGSSSVEAWESSSVEAWESSRVEAWGSSSVVARESSRVVARESSSVEAWESSRVVAWGSSSVEAWESSSVEAWGSSSVEAWESSSVEARESSRVVARESSRVVARESSRVEAWGSSSVEAWESSSVVARESSRVEASPFVAVQKHGDKPKIKGGVLIQIPRLDTAEKWLEYYGVPAKRGIAVLFKAVGDDWHSSRSGPKGKVSYAPGTKPQAEDWDGGKAECGGGLHFSPHPQLAKDFNREGSRFVACPVRVDEIVVHPEGQFPNKVKAPRVVGRGCYEVDEHGERVAK